MIIYKKLLRANIKIIIAVVTPITLLLFVIFYGMEVREEKESLPLNLPCRGNMIVEAKYDNQRAKMVSSLYFSFLDNNKILISLSGTAYLYNSDNKLIERKTLLRNIYYDYVRQSRAADTYSLTSYQINIDSVDNMDWQLSSRLLMNSFFVSGHTDTLVLKKYDANSMLIESNQSPIALCVFKKSL